MRGSGTALASGRHLRAARAAAGLEQKELAALAGLHRKSVQRIEAMDCIMGSVHAVKRMVEVLEQRGVTVSRWPVPTVVIGEPVEHPEPGQVSQEDDFRHRHAREDAAPETADPDLLPVTMREDACPLGDSRPGLLGVISRDERAPANLINNQDFQDEAAEDGEPMSTNENIPEVVEEPRPVVARLRPAAHHIGPAPRSTFEPDPHFHLMGTTAWTRAWMA